MAEIIVIDKHEFITATLANFRSYAKQSVQHYFCNDYENTWNAY